MHDMDRTRVEPGPGFAVPDARAHEDDAPENDQQENDFHRPGGLPGEARGLELAMRLLDAAEGALEVARLAAEATRRGMESPLGVASTMHVPADAADARCVGRVELGDADLGGLGRSGRWIRRGQRIILLGA